MTSDGGISISALRERHRVVDVVWRWRVPILVGVATLVGALLAYRARPIVLYDDAAITMRYASRIANGDGWTYNDGDRTNGASAPLYTLVLAAMDVVGINVVTAARLVCSVAFAASFGLVALLASRISGFVAGVLATLFLYSWFDFQTQALGGMESALAVALGLAVIVALREDRDTWAGVFLGLALFNKLDAGLLAAAVAVAYLAILHRPPWRVAWVSAAVVLPWFVFSTVYFGSPWPHSFTQKVSDALPEGAPYDSTWILDLLDRQEVLWVVALAVASLAFLPRLAKTAPRSAVALAICVAWPVFHGVAFSLIDLGDRYAWYLTALYPTTAVAAGCALGLTIKLVTGRPRPVAYAAMAAVVVVALVAIGVPRQGGGQVGAVTETILEGHTTNEYEAFEEARRQAGVALAEIAEPDDVISTCFGWVAFAAADNTIDESCPLNTRDPVGPPRYGTLVTFPGRTEPELDEGVRIVATFYSDVGEGGRVDIVEYPGFGPTG